MTKTITVSATLTKAQQQKDNNYMYFCTFRGKPMHVAGRMIQFECSEDTSERDILKHFLKKDELQSLEINIKYN